jgi:hypothetical protein
MELLVISVADMEKMLRYMLSYGSGGFQQRFAAATGRRGAPRKEAVLTVRSLGSTPVFDRFRRR